MNFCGKMKAVTFSFDDGVTQDRRLTALFNRYGLRGTFNVNSGLLGRAGELTVAGERVRHDKIDPGEVASLYRGHEVAVHTLTHPNLTQLDEEEIIRQVEQDRLALERLTGGPVAGMAYPCGGVNNDDRVAEILGRRTGVRYARTITSTGRFDLPENLLRLDPTVHCIRFEELFALGERFVGLQPETPQLFYIWGHSYEFDAGGGWRNLEEFCRFIAGRGDIAYLTNREILL